jgi:hypothetical protein
MRKAVCLEVRNNCQVSVSVLLLCSTNLESPGALAGIDIHRWILFTYVTAQTLLQARQWAAGCALLFHPDRPLSHRSDAHGCCDVQETVSYTSQGKNNIQTANRKQTASSVQQDQQDAPFVFSLLWINSLYMFRALFTHHQEALHEQQLVCCRRHNTHTKYTNCCTYSTCWRSANSARNLWGLLTF